MWLDELSCDLGVSQQAASEDGRRSRRCVVQQSTVQPAVKSPYDRLRESKNRNPTVTSEWKHIISYILTIINHTLVAVIYHEPFSFFMIEIWRWEKPLGVKQKLSDYSDVCCCSKVTKEWVVLPARWWCPLPLAQFSHPPPPPRHRHQVLLWTNSNLCNSGRI